MRPETLVAALAVSCWFASTPDSVAWAIGPVRLETFDEEFWASTTIVVAKVTDYTAPFDTTKPSYVELEPIATLCGTLDPGQTKSVVAELWWSPFSLVQEKPTVGKNVLVLLRHRTDSGDRRDRPYWVEQGICRFMPKGLSLIEIDGVTDARIAEVTSAVRKLRTESRQARSTSVAKP